MRLAITLSITLLLLIAQAAYAQGSESSSLEWGKPITFDDFEAEAVRTDTAAANISVTILLGYASKKTGELTFRVVAVMDKNESWIKDEFKRDHILRHEQGHFDIAHIYAKKLEATLKQNRYTGNDVQTLNEMYETYLQQMNVEQLRYDLETKGGWDPLAQSKWRRYIAAELAKL